ESVCHVSHDLLMFYCQHPESTAIYTLSLHDALPICTEVELFGNRTTATLGMWSEQKVAVAAVVTALKRQISKKSGAEYARLTLRSEEHTSELQSRVDLVCRLLLEKKKKTTTTAKTTR